MKDALLHFYNGNKENIHGTAKVALYSFGILGTLQYLLELGSVLGLFPPGPSKAGLDPRVDFLFILPVVAHFFLRTRERIEPYFGLTTGMALGLFLKHLFISVDPGFAITFYFAFFIGGVTPLFLAFVLWPKVNREQAQLVKQEVKPAQPVDFGPYPLKLDEEGKVRIPTKIMDANLHTIGGTGSGKTRYGINSWIYQTVVEQKLGALVYDVKADMDAFLVYILKKAGRLDDLWYLSLRNVDLSHNINPLSSGSPTQVANRLYKGLYYDEDKSHPHWNSLASSVLNNLVPVLRWEYEIINFQMVFECLNDTRDMKKLRELCNKRPKSNEAKYFENNWLSKTQKQRQDELSGLLNKLQRFCNREWAPLVNSLEPDFTLREAIEKNKVVYLGLDSMRNPDDAKPLSIMLMMQFDEALANRYGTYPPKPFRVFLDEFYNAAYDGFIDFINKCRSASIEFILAHQSVADLTRISTEYPALLGDSARNKVYMRVDRAETAQYCSDDFGTVKDNTPVFSFDTRSALFDQAAGYTLPGGRRYRVLPDEMKEVPEGYAFVKIPFSAGPEYFFIKLMDSVPLGPPLKGFEVRSVIPVRNRHKRAVEGFKEEVREDLLSGRTPRSKPNLDKLNKLAEDQLKKKPKPPSPPKTIDEDKDGDGQEPVKDKKV